MRPAVVGLGTVVADGLPLLGRGEARRRRRAALLFSLEARGSYAE